MDKNNKKGKNEGFFFVSRSVSSSDFDVDLVWREKS